MKNIRLSILSLLLSGAAYAQPTVGSVSPLIAQPGATVTISGTNFNTTAGNNFVYFGASQAVVNTATATSLTVVVPQGATQGPVTVTNNATNLTAYSRLPFLPTYDNSPYAPNSVNFAGLQNFAAGTNPRAIAISDIDGDGMPDLVVANDGSGTISVFRNVAAPGPFTGASLEASVDFAVGTNPQHVAIGDIDGDGKPDIAVANFGSNSLSVFLNTSTPGTIDAASFDAAITVGTPGQPFSVAIGDVDGDGKPDLAATNYDLNTVSLFQNTGSVGSITFAAAFSRSTAFSPQVVLLADIDGDSKPELIVSNGHPNNISVSLNTSTPSTIDAGSFGPMVDFTTDVNPHIIQVADLDIDGKPDIITANANSSSVSLLRNTSTLGSITAGSLASVAILAGNFVVLGVGVGDFDGDGKPDLAATNENGFVSVFRNISSPGSLTSGSFTTGSLFAAGGIPRAIAVGDLNADGLPDMAVANFSSDNISLIRNNPMLPITGITSLCTGTTTTLSNATGGGAWVSGTPAVATIVGGTGVLTAVSVGVTVISYVISGSVATVSVTVTPGPTISVPATICAGTLFTFSATPAGGVWSSTNGAVITVTPATGAVTASSPGSTIIQNTSVAGCVSTVNVTVAPAIAANSGNPTLCLGQPISGLVLTNADPGGTWTSGDLSTVIVSPLTGNIFGLQLGTAIITYAITGACFATTEVTVTPAVATITGTADICVGTNVTLANATGGGTWVSSNTATATVNPASGQVTGISGGSATITYLITGGCYAVTTQVINAIPGNITGNGMTCQGATLPLFSSPLGGTWSSSTTATATVNTTTGLLTPGATPGIATITYQLPTGCIRTRDISVNVMPANITGNASVCMGLSSTLSSTTGGGVWSSSNTGRASVDAGTGAVTGITTGTAIISYTLNGCSATKIVTVSSLSVISGAPAVCASSTTTLTALPAGGAWSSSAPGIASITSGSGIVTSGAGAGNTTIQYTTSAGCSNTHLLSVNIAPAAITGIRKVCTGYNTALSSSGGGVWSSSNTVKASVNPSTGLVSGLSGGTTVISYSVGIGCYQSVIVTVNTTPPAITGPLTVCEGSTISQVKTSAGGTWSSSNTAKATIGGTSGVVAGIDDGTTTITYTGVTGCIATREITVNSTPAAITGTLTACIGSTTTLNSTPGGGAWTSSNAARASVNAATGEVTARTAGTAFITYTSGGCYKTAVVTAIARPGAITGNNTICEGAVSTLACTPAGGTWSSSNTGMATVSAVGTVRGINDGSFTITYQAATGCIKTRTCNVIVAPDPIVQSGPVCTGSTTTFTSSPGGGVWSSSVPTKATINASTGVLNGIAFGTSMITYALGGCSVTKPIGVNTRPAVTGTFIVCANNKVTLSSTDIGGEWTSADPAVASINGGTGVVTGVNAGNTTIVYTAVTGCVRNVGVTVNTAVPANTGNALICTGQAAAVPTIFNAVSGGTWSTSNTSRISISPTTGALKGLSAGIANISYALSPGCFTVTQATVNGPVAAITGSVSACVGTTTILANTTPSGTWSSSNTTTTTANAATGEATAIASGSATISYIVSPACYKTITHTVLSSPGTITGASTVNDGTTTTLSCSPGGGSWSSMTPLYATVAASTGVVTGVDPGAAVIKYQLSSGCYSTHNITVIAARQGTPLIPADESLSISIYPNPSRGALTIETPVSGLLMVYAMDGKTVAQFEISGTTNSISLPAGLAAGTYLCRFAGSDGSAAIVRLMYQP